MKKLIIIILLGILSIPAQNGGHNIDYVSLYERYRRESILVAIIAIESRGDIFISNSQENAVGLLQIRPIMVKDVNRILGRKKYNLNDRFNKIKSIEMFNIYQDYYNPGLNPEKAAKIWNGGPNGMNKKSTDKYYTKFLQEWTVL